jgi:hypothetical protein
MLLGGMLGWLAGWLQYWNGNENAAESIGSEAAWTTLSTIKSNYSLITFSLVDLVEELQTQHSTVLVNIGIAKLLPDSCFPSCVLLALSGRHLHALSHLGSSVLGCWQIACYIGWNLLCDFQTSLLLNCLQQ